MSTIAPFSDASQIRRAELFQNPEQRRRVIRRRPTQTQGQALEKLGRAVEYLVDSRMALIHEPSTRSDSEALDILMRLSRCVFSECEEIVPVGQRLKAWMAGEGKMRVQ